MARPDRNRIKEVFAEALRVPREERAVFLGAACAGDEALISEVAALLSAHEGAAEFMADPTMEGPGTRIGPYKLLERIGEGGFGSVFMAEQEEPIRRRVALKVLKLGVDTRQVIARFEAERQALALMDHPNIARVLDAGTTASGRPYFVMELVKGVPITTYCDEAHLSTAERVSVFLPVCHAIQHAHQKGIIHRDLKPSNVLVTLHDGKPVPKVIDFGIAKATEQKLTEKTLFTGFGQMIGTPAYMSPEQAEMSGLDIDTRSDVYSLGVLLYELLAGSPPFDPTKLKQAGVAEILRIIKEVDPPKPSTRVSTLGERLATVAARRGIEPRKLGALLRGDLDCVIMKALAKERQRRYDSASTMAQDLERYLAHEPVSASPPGVAYRTAKFVRRNRVGVVAAALVALALVGGLTGTTLGLLRAKDAEKLAKDNAEDADRKFQIAREGADLLLFQVVRELPKVAGTRGLQRKVLDAALRHYEKLQATKAGDVREQRRIWVAFQELGDVYMALGEEEQAHVAHARFHALVSEAIAADPEDARLRHDLAVSFERQGNAAYALGRIEEALANYQKDLEILEDLARDDPRDERNELSIVYCQRKLSEVEAFAGNDSASDAWLDRILPRLEALVAANPQDAERLRELARILGRRAESSSDPRPLLDRAAGLAEQVERIEGSTPANRLDRIDLELQRAALDSMTGRRPEAEARAIAARGLLEPMIAAEPQNPVWQWRFVEIQQFLADSAFNRGAPREARALVAEANEKARRLDRGAEGVVLFRLEWALSCERLARLSFRLGDLAEARETCGKALEVMDELHALVPDNLAHVQGVVSTHTLLGEIMMESGELGRARELLDRADELSERGIAGLGETFLLHPRVRVLLKLSELDSRTGDLARARMRGRECLALAERLPKPGPGVRDYQDTLAVVLDRLADHAVLDADLEDGLELRRRNVQACEEIFERTPSNATARYNLAMALSKLGTLIAENHLEGDLEPLAVRALALAEETATAEPENLQFQGLLASAVEFMGVLQRQQGDVAGAIERFRRALAIKETVVARQRGGTQALVGLALCCEKLAEACWTAKDEAGTRSATVRLLEVRKQFAEAPDVRGDAYNLYAWTLLTCQPPDLRDAKLALEYALRAAEGNGQRDPGTLDTLALAYFENGDAARAADTQERALGLLSRQSPVRRASYESRLEKYRAGAR